MGGDILDIERTIQLAVAPAFLLSGIMAVLNILTTRLSRLVDRTRALRAGAEPAPGEMSRLRRRARLVQFAITGCILSAFLLCALLVISFAGPFFDLRVGLLLGALLVAALIVLMGSLAFFLAEIWLTTLHLDEA
ncbi:DUF2721 domain-containing protein [Roseomonas gilardii]|uniref:DUF2721 domain-containing protein n=1 Tax=Roseomonas gilardii TaxID=257708 RepID=UPI0016439713|nr:DUF2721 domain-containing protein [Roseomonas gilardii]